jgi:hypothetical protein
MNSLTTLNAIINGEIDSPKLDHMTIIVHGNGPKPHNFIYSLPHKPDVLLRARADSWRFLDTTIFKCDHVYSFAAFLFMQGTTKVLCPIEILEVTEDMIRAQAQSKNWNYRILSMSPKAFADQYIFTCDPALLLLGDED